jgi:hypothetical protein
VNLRRRLATLTRAAIARELWMLDLCHDGDALCRLAGTDTPALTRSAFDALPDDRERILVIFADGPEPSRP